MNNELSQWPVWADEPVYIEDYNKKWPLQYNSLVRELDELYSFEYHTYEHIGSTAVPGLCSKPIIDLILPVDNFKNIPIIISTLKSKNWNLIPPELDNHPNRRLFVKVVENKRYAHFSLIINTSSEISKLISFRDLLRNNPAILTEYSVLKRDLGFRFKYNREAYTDAKSHFIKNILMKV